MSYLSLFFHVLTGHFRFHCRSPPIHIFKPNGEKEKGWNTVSQQCHHSNVCSVAAVGITKLLQLHQLILYILMPSFKFMHVGKPGVAEGRWYSFLCKLYVLHPFAGSEWWHLLDPDYSASLCDSHIQLAPPLWRNKRWS